MDVVVEWPDIDGETVVFRWKQSAPNLAQHSNSFSFRYQGVDLHAFTPELFAEVFLGLQLRVFAASAGPVTIRFPFPVPRSIVTFWTAFHNAHHVAISPVAAIDRYCVWVEGATLPPTGPSSAVFFGGGKDSMLAACLLAEIDGSDQVLLVQYVRPMERDPKLLAARERRQEKLMLRPAREALGFTTRTVWTDLQAQFTPEGAGLRPGLELYTAGALPLLLAHGVRRAGFCIAWQSYSIKLLPAGERHYRYARARAEMLAAQSAHYRQAFGVDLEVTNYTLGYSSIAAFGILAMRYPDGLARIVMCNRARVHQRWCYHCLKCAEYALYSLRFGIVDPRFDYNHFFEDSRYMRDIATYAETGVERSMFGNAPWQPFVGTKRGYQGICHAFALIDPAVITAKLSPTGLAHLLIGKALFGNCLFPSYEMVSASALATLGPELGPPVRAITEEHVEVVTELPGPFLSGIDPCEYDFSERVAVPRINTSPEARVQGR